MLNAGRKKCGLNQDQNLAGLLYVSSGLGGMSGAQPKAAKIADAVAIIAEVDESRIQMRYQQGWIDEIITDLQDLFAKAQQALKLKKSLSIGYYGNVVDLLEFIVKNHTSASIFYQTKPLVMLFMMEDIVPKDSLFKNGPSSLQRIALDFGKWSIKAYKNTFK